ncbi:MFS transporter [Microvirga lenta]|uniref:MFS transporter n=1 Tax=Microvirga lenta TaxID=2881337 RepID=UPI001CFFEE9C|nr:MFS transporter [Microvirga lenta]MCB5177641.1 MFS transporter [Microvirga lenta]
MVGILRSVLVLLLAILLLMAGNGPLNTIIGVRLEAAGTAPAIIGAVMSAYFGGLTLGSLFAYRIVTGYGHIRAFTAFASALSGISLVYALHLDPLLWSLLRLSEGFCMAGLFICVESWLNDRTTSETRGKILAFYMVCLYAGQAGGQFMLNLQDESGFLLFALVSILISFAVIPVALTRVAPPILPHVEGLSFYRLYEASPLGMVGTVSSGLVLGSFYSLGPSFSSEIGLDLSQTGMFMSAVIFGGVLLQLPVGRLSDVFDRRLVIIGVLTAMVLVSVGTAAAAYPGSSLLYWAALVFGGASFALYPLCVAHMNDHLGAAARVSASGGLILAYSAGATLGPLLSSGVMTLTGAPGLFAFTAMVSSFALVFGLWRMRARPSPPAEQQGPYQMLPRTTPVIAPLDPRSEPGDGE